MYVTVALQLILAFALVFSLAAVVDCRYVTADLSASNYTDQSPPDFLPADQPRGYGQFYWEGKNGGCFWHPNVTTGIMDEYLDFTGRDWLAPRGVGCLAAMFASVIWFWTLTFNCIANAKIVRFVLAGVMLAIVTPFQGCLLLFLRSDFCTSYNCRFDRAAGFTVIATLLFAMCRYLIGFRLVDYPQKEQQSAIELSRRYEANAEENAVGYSPSELELDGIGAAMEVEPPVVVTGSLLGNHNNGAPEFTKGWCLHH